MDTYVGLIMEDPEERFLEVVLDLQRVGEEIPGPEAAGSWSRMAREGNRKVAVYLTPRGTRAYATEFRRLVRTGEPYNPGGWTEEEVTVRNVRAQYQFAISMVQ